MTHPVHGGAANIRRFDALGRQFGVRCDDPRSQDALDHLLAPFAALTADHPPKGPVIDLAAGPTGGWVVQRAGAVVTTSPSWETAVTALLAELNHDAVDAFAGFAVHAGVVAMDGVAVALPGTSGAGKSTLTAACVLAGFDYVSDEALCIDRERGRVVPYPKPLSLSRSSWDLLGRTDTAGAALRLEDADELTIAVADLGGRVAEPEPELRLGHVVELTRRDGSPRLVAQPRQVALALLLSMSFNHYKEPQASFELASRLAAECSAWRLEYDDPRSAAELLRVELGPVIR